MSKEQLQLEKAYCVEDFDIEAFKRDVWANATDEQKDYAISLNFNQGDFDNVQSALFRDALTYGNWRVAQFLWGEASNDQKKAILEAHADNKYRAFWYTWADATEAKEAGALDNLLINMEFILNEYGEEEVKNIIEHDNYVHWRQILNKPEEIFKTFWGHTNPEQQTAILLSDGVMEWFSKNMGHPNAALVLSKVEEVAVNTIYEQYYTILKQRIVGQKKGQKLQDIENLITHIIDSKIADDSKDGILMFIVAGIAENIEQNYEALLMIHGLLPNDKFMNTRGTFAECDKKRVQRFKNAIEKTSNKQPKFHQLIEGALKRSFQHSQLNVLDLLFKQGDYTTLTLVFKGLYRPSTYTLDVITKCEALAEKYLKKLPEYISEPKADKKDEYKLFQVLSTVKNVVDDAKRKAEEKAEKQKKITGEEDFSHEFSREDSLDSDDSTVSEEAEENYFSVKNWKLEKEAILDSLFGEDDPDRAVSRALDHLARHARWALRSNAKTDRAKAGRVKAEDLQQLLEGLSQDNSLEKAQQRLENVLDKNTVMTPLLKNRGGFHGAYEKMSDFFGNRNLFHFHYEHNAVSRNAVSRTDHYLIELYDAIVSAQYEKLDSGASNA